MSTFHAKYLGLIWLGFVFACDISAAANCQAIDGDTVQCGPDRIRLRGVYAVEKGSQGGAQARENLQRKLDSGEVRVVPKAKDTYGRTVADVYVNNRKIAQSDIGPKGGRGTSSAGSGQPKATNPKGDPRRSSKLPSGPGPSARGNSSSNPAKSSKGTGSTSGLKSAGPGDAKAPKGTGGSLGSKSASSGSAKSSKGTSSASG